MYKKKAPLPPVSSYSPLIAAVIMLIVLCISEYFFYFPSRVLHNPQIVRSWFDESKTPPCPTDYAPVCGKNKKTYTNSCESKLAGIAVARVGKCETAVDTPIIDTSLSGVSTPLSVPANPSSVIVSSSTGMIGSGGELDMTKYQLYTNTSFKYSLVLPKYAYFQGLVSQDKKTHILTIDLTASGVLSNEKSLIKVTYYKSGLSASPGEKTIVLESGRLVLDYVLPLSPKAQEIVSTIEATAKSLE